MTAETKKRSEPSLNCVDPQNYTDWTILAPWDVFFSDLVLTVHHILTEPTCPSVKIAFEMPERAGTDVLAHGCGDTLEEAIATAVAKAKEKVDMVDPKRCRRGIKRSRVRSTSSPDRSLPRRDTVKRAVANRSWTRARGLVM